MAVSSGYHHGLALKSDGSLVGWGYNNNGQASVPAGNNFAAIAAGGYHSLALRSDGSLVGWGLNDDGQVNVPDGGDFVAIAAGGFHNVALKADGSLVAWGFSNQGITSVPAGNDYSRITSGSYHSLAVKPDGSLIGWGSDFDFQTFHLPVGKGYFAMAEGDGTVWRSRGFLSQRPPCYRNRRLRLVVTCTSRIQWEQSNLCRSANTLSMKLAPPRWPQDS